MAIFKAAFTAQLFSTSITGCFTPWAHNGLKRARAEGETNRGRYDEPSELKLVMVDDNADEIFLTRRQVRKEGIVNNFVSERKPERLIEALGELEQAGVDKNKLLILLDIKMPRSNGFDTLGTIRADPAYKNVPVIMLSASDDEADMFEAFDLGANGYVVKPFKAA
jgi:CheY-like chemotaxis protein